ncbi:MAG TPA: ABC transporter permease [Candidatus Nanopelagicaceae bacterium]
MLKMIGRRLLLSVVIVWVVTSIVFLATQALPGDAAKAILGREATPDRLAQLRQQLGTGKPVLEQYYSWINKLVHGNFGTSLASNQPVWTYLKPLILNSLTLMLIAAVVSASIGLLLGVLTAAKRDSWLDHFTTVVTLVLAALPEFVIGVTLTWLFSTGVFHWLPAIYAGAPGQSAWRSPTQLVLPAMTLVIAVTPYLARMLRGTLIEVLETDYVQHARLKGLPERVVMVRHAIPNALGPVIQVLALQFAWLAGGVIIVEYLFRFPGIGTAVANSVATRDLPVTQALAVFFALFYVTVNLLADLLTLVLNPRVRTAS